MNPCIKNRRQFLGQAGSLAATAALAPWGSALSAPLAGGDYRALVCVFLYGGNDGNNMVVPLDASGYAAYAKARGNAGSGGLALQQSTLAPLNGSTLGLHAALAPLADIWNQGHLAVQANVGTLIRPLSMAEYQGGKLPLPGNLFSHSDQQSQWQQGASGLAKPSGWAGRIADLQPVGGAVPTVISVSGNAVFINGVSSDGLAVSSSGSFAIKGFGSNPAKNPLYSLYTSLLQQNYANAEERAAAAVMNQALAASNALNSALSGTGSVAGLFNGQNNSLAQQLLAVAKMIEARQSLGVSRQIFFVSLGGFDTHNDQLAQQNNLFGQLGPALKAFYDATLQLGVASQVSTFTASDFARTLQPASGGGSDHAWGNHQFVIGGAVRSGIYGRMPQLVLAGPDDVSEEGRWLPSTSVDQMSATLASWFGVGAADLGAMFPQLANFSQRNMGYFG
ncbi:DUF1501 domain-containing protein [Paucibacter sp. APW11]|uniref:DUF1501 domain-containing protein n=1 Tax=Roseateles aquae TaxID=3077235 RepID=A0ABU3PCV1_9BURK|nr:DUF1501 domain-containing protein [Paucibacter sp. APW11]MDT9000429.1 DUF1501 domain-containing protein [Paucibacter sp. APW11]